MKSNKVKEQSNSFLGFGFICALLILILFGVSSPVAYVANDNLSVSIVSPLEDNGGLPINIQDQTSPAIDTYFLREVSLFNLSENTTKSNETNLVYDFNLSGGHGLVVDDEIQLLDIVSQIAFYGIVKNVNVNTITVDRPIDHVFSTSSIAQNVSSEMAVDGSVNPVIFTVRAGTNPIDFTRFIISIIDDGTMDDGKFGSIVGGLDYGFIFRIYDGTQKTIFNFKTNGGIKNFCYDGSYTPATQGPSGNEGFSARISFGGQSKHGVVLRVSNEDVLQWIVQDDLTSLVSLRVVGQGHEVTD